MKTVLKNKITEFYKFSRPHLKQTKTVLQNLVGKLYRFSLTRLKQLRTKDPFHPRNGEVINGGKPREELWFSSQKIQNLITKRIDPIQILISSMIICIVIQLLGITVLISRTGTHAVTSEQARERFDDVLVLTKTLQANTDSPLPVSRSRNDTFEDDGGAYLEWTDSQRSQAGVSGVDLPLNDSIPYEDYGSYGERSNIEWTDSQRSQAGVFGVTLP